MDPVPNVGLLKFYAPPLYKILYIKYFVILPAKKKYFVTLSVGSHWVKWFPFLWRQPISPINCHTMYLWTQLMLLAYPMHCDSSLSSFYLIISPSIIYLSLSLLSLTFSPLPNVIPPIVPSAPHSSYSFWLHSASPRQCWRLQSSGDTSFLIPTLYVFGYGSLCGSWRFGVSQITPSVPKYRT